MKALILLVLVAMASCKAVPNGQYCSLVKWDNPEKKGFTTNSYLFIEVKNSKVEKLLFPGGEWVADLESQVFDEKKYTNITTKFDLRTENISDHNFLYHIYIIEDRFCANPQASN